MAGTTAIMMTGSLRSLPRRDPFLVLPEARYWQQEQSRDPSERRRSCRTVVTWLTFAPQGLNEPVRGVPSPDPPPASPQIREKQSMDLNLAGHVAVVTGAGKGIGLAVTRSLVDEGAQVVAGSLTTDSLDGLKGVTPVAVDLTEPDGPASLIRRAIEVHGRL